MYAQTLTTVNDVLSFFNFLKILKYTQKLFVYLKLCCFFETFGTKADKFSATKRDQLGAKKEERNCQWEKEEFLKIPCCLAEFDVVSIVLTSFTSFFPTLPTTFIQDTHCHSIATSLRVYSYIRGMRACNRKLHFQIALSHCTYKF